jgi:hypothetical protein
VRKGRIFKTNKRNFSFFTSLHQNFCSSVLIGTTTMNRYEQQRKATRQSRKIASSEKLKRSEKKREKEDGKWKGRGILSALCSREASPCLVAFGLGTLREFSIFRGSLNHG